jgi:hypothetical protein
MMWRRLAGIGGAGMAVLDFTLPQFPTAQRRMQVSVASLEQKDKR